MIEFLAYCRERGLLLQVRNDTLLVSPAAKLMPDDAAFIRANKAAILAELRAVGTFSCWPIRHIPNGAREAKNARSELRTTSWPNRQT